MLAYSIRLYLNRPASLAAMKKQVTPKYYVRIEGKKNAHEQRIRSAKTPIPPSPASSPVKNFAQELAELTQLFRLGHLSESEFTLAKKKLVQ